MLADDLNGLSGRYRALLLELRKKSQELASDMESGKAATGAGDPVVTGKIADKTGEIVELFNQIRL